MRRWWLALALATAGCGGAGGGDVASATMQLSADNVPSIAAVELIVFDGKNAGCARALAGASPLDDAGLDVVAHALFTIDGTPKHLALPAGKPLVFYAEAFNSPAASRARVGRGCVEATLAAGGSSGVSITIDAEEKTR
jgi:hypothetical protein